MPFSIVNATTSQIIAGPFDDQAAALAWADVHLRHADGWCVIDAEQATADAEAAAEAEAELAEDDDGLAADAVRARRAFWGLAASALMLAATATLGPVQAQTWQQRQQGWQPPPGASPARPWSPPALQPGSPSTMPNYGPRVTTCIPYGGTVQCITR